LAEIPATARGELKRALSDAALCRDCPRMDTDQAVVGFVGTRVRRPVLFVAEAPGRLGAVKTRLPLSGDVSGRNFESLLEAAGWSRSDVWVANAVMCWPCGANGNNGRPNREELLNCSRHLARQVEIIDPLVIVSLGLVALDALRLLAPIERGPLRQLVGQRFNWANRVLVPLYHPSPRVVNTTRSLSEQTLDFRALRELVDERLRLAGRRRLSAVA
jgi:uracil-DNA glycosylase family 4